MSTCDVTGLSFLDRYEKCVLNIKYYLYLQKNYSSQRKACRALEDSRDANLIRIVHLLSMNSVVSKFGWHLLDKDISQIGHPEVIREVGPA